MNLSTIIVVAILAVAVFFVVRAIRKGKHHGSCGCGCHGKCDHDHCH